MEEKEVLNEEKTEEVSGGRHYAKGSRLLSPEKVEELMKSAVRLDSASRHELPKEFLTQVSGGMGWEDEEEDGECPYCGGPTYLYYNNGEWVCFCKMCYRTLWGSDFWLYPDDFD